jgi:hypothetical protein
MYVLYILIFQQNLLLLLHTVLQCVVFHSLPQPVNNICNMLPPYVNVIMELCLRTLAKVLIGMTVKKM